MKTNALIAISILCCLSQATIAQDMSPEQMVSNQNAIFQQLHLVPIFLPKDEGIGDILDIAHATLLASGKDCFQNLEHVKVASQLPSYLVESKKGLAAAIGVPSIAQIGAEAGEGNIYRISFTDVMVEKVSLYKLRTSLKHGAQECDTVRPFLDASYQTTPNSKLPQNQSDVFVPIKPDFLKSVDMLGPHKEVTSNNPPPFLVGTLFTARRVIEIKTAKSLDASAKLTLGQKILSMMGLKKDYKVGADANTDDQSTVELVGKETVPVAFAPAFVVTGMRQDASGKKVFQIAALDGDGVESATKYAANEAKTRFAKAVLSPENQASSSFMFDQKTWASIIVQQASKSDNSFSYSKTDALKAALGVVHAM